MILVEETMRVINTEEVSRGTLIWAKHKTWDDGQTGIVTDSNEQQITVRYVPSVQNVTNHYFIRASELANGEWQIRYSSDGLRTVNSFGCDDEAGEESGS